jgi:hypothetical protein
LPDDCVQALFINVKLFKTFYENASKQGYESEEFARFAGHVCYKNREFSRKIAKHILKGTNVGIAEEISPFLELMKQYLAIEDEYYELRVEWIFGVSDLVIRTNNYPAYNQ